MINTGLLLIGEYFQLTDLLCDINSMYNVCFTKFACAAYIYMYADCTTRTCMDESLDRPQEQMFPEQNACTV